MEMRLSLNKDDLETIIRDATPVRIHMSGPDEPERWVELEEPSPIELVPDVGAVLRAKGRFHFKAAGVPLEDEIRKIRVTIRPEIDKDETGTAALMLHIDLDEADLVTAPDLVDRGIAKIVDKALQANATRMMVPFGKLLTASGELSERVQPLSRARTAPERASVTIREDGVTFAVDMNVDFEREGGMGKHPAS